MAPDSVGHRFLSRVVFDDDKVRRRCSGRRHDNFCRFGREVDDTRLGSGWKWILRLENGFARGRMIAPSRGCAAAAGSSSVRGRSLPAEATDAPSPLLCKLAVGISTFSMV